MFGYIGRHWRGELSLPQSYWVNGILLGLPLNIYFRVLAVAYAADPPRSPSTYVGTVLLPFLAALPLAVWQGVGVWRSAGRRIAQGDYGWAWLARIVILGNLASVAYMLVTYGALNYSLVRAAMVERSAQFEIVDRGSYVTFHGEITEAAADRLVDLLSKSKVQRFVVDGSNGGFLQPTLRVAKVITKRKLMVVTLGSCASACTALLAAGDVRAISPFTLVQLHRGTFVGLDKTAEGWSDVEALYRHAGMTPRLIAKMGAHAGPYDLYEPTMRETIEGGFITYVLDHQYIAAAQWCAANREKCDRTGTQNRALYAKAKEKT